MAAERILMFAGNQEQAPCWALHTRGNLLTSHNHPWRMCYSFPHSRQFHFVGVDASTVSGSQLWRVLTVGLGNRDLFGWLRRLLLWLLGEFRVRLFCCLDLQGLARQASSPTYCILAESLSTHVLSARSLWSPPFSFLLLIIAVTGLTGCPHLGQWGWGSGVFGPCAQEPHKGRGNVTASAPTALSTDLWANSSCVDIFWGTPFSFCFLSLKSTTSFVGLAYGTCSCKVCVPASRVSMCIGTFTHSFPAPSDAQLLLLFLGCCLSSSAGCQTIGCNF